MPHIALGSRITKKWGQILIQQQTLEEWVYWDSNVSCKHSLYIHTLIIINTTVHTSIHIYRYTFTCICMYK